MPQPLEFDVEKVHWELTLQLANSLQGKVSINMIHVAKWNCSKELF